MKRKRSIIKVEGVKKQEREVKLMENKELFLYKVHIDHLNNIDAICRNRQKVKHYHLTN